MLKLNLSRYRINKLYIKFSLKCLYNINFEKDSDCTNLMLQVLYYVNIFINKKHIKHIKDYENIDYNEMNHTILRITILCQDISISTALTLYSFLNKFNLEKYNSSLEVFVPYRISSIVLLVVLGIRGNHYGGPNSVVFFSKPCISFKGQILDLIKEKEAFNNLYNEYLNILSNNTKLSKEILKKLERENGILQIKELISYKILTINKSL